MQRKEKWLFSKTAVELSTAAHDKAAHHEERAAFWRDLLEKATEEAKEKGLRIIEPQAGMSYTTSVAGPQMQVDPSYQQRIVEAHQKVQHHEAMRREYRGWQQAMEDSAGSFQCDIDDWLFFFGK